MENDEYAIGLRFCGDLIRQWKTGYARKNSRKFMKINTRICFEAPEEIFWKRYLELWVGGKMLQQHLIKPEAYDTLTRDKNLPKDNYPGIEFTILFSFQPEVIEKPKKVKCELKISGQEKPCEQKYLINILTINDNDFKL